MRSRPRRRGRCAPSRSTSTTLPVATASLEATGAVSVEVVLRNRDGLHVRPAALIVGALTGKDATLAVARPGRRPFP